MPEIDLSITTTGPTYVVVLYGKAPSLARVSRFYYVTDERGVTDEPLHSVYVTSVVGVKLVENVLHHVIALLGVDVEFTRVVAKNVGKRGYMVRHAATPGSSDTVYTIVLPVDPKHLTVRRLTKLITVATDSRGVDRHPEFDQAQYRRLLESRLTLKPRLPGRRYAMVPLSVQVVLGAAAQASQSRWKAAHLGAAVVVGAGLVGLAAHQKRKTREEPGVPVGG